MIGQVNHLDLFSGIGGFALAARWMNWQTIAFCEIDEYCQRVLAKNFPNIPIHSDIEKLDATVYRGRVSILTGGFPCQPHSAAGKGLGTKDERYLWPKMYKVIKDVSPNWIVAENVSGLRTTAADEILSDLEEEGYSCWPLVVGALHTGAPHERRRVWIIANSNREGLEEWKGQREDNGSQFSTPERSSYRPYWRSGRDAPEPRIRRVDDGLPSWVVKCSK
jgi:DNA (cytosine-5)-methyltransferase 1